MGYWYLGDYKARALLVTRHRDYARAVLVFTSEERAEAFNREAWKGPYPPVVLPATPEKLLAQRDRGRNPRYCILDPTVEDFAGGRWDNGGTVFWPLTAEVLKERA